jgi:cytochrome P450
MSEVHRVSLFSSQFWADPFPFFARLRAEQPVYRAVLPPKIPIWLVTRYEDIQRLFKDDRFTKNKVTAMTPEQLRRQPWIPPMFRPLERNMLDLDPPDHTRLRALVHRAFTPRLIDQMRGRVQAVADGLLDAVQSRGKMELIRDYALPLPMTIITEILGVPTRDREKFHRWSKVIVSINAFNATWRLFPILWNFTRYLRRFFKLRRAEPRDDLTTALIQAEADEEGERLNEGELLAMVYLLLIAGHETTVNLISSGVLALLQHPDQMEMLRRDPALLKTAIEELLRYTSPVFLSTERYPRQDVTIRGVTIPRGEHTFGAIGSANRDGTVFEDADRLDITRTENRHLSFGSGIHYCLGAPLARLESEIAIDTLLRRMPGLRLESSPESLRWRQSLILRGLEELRVVF